MKPVILHISNDYPDPLLPAKTKAIYALVEGTPQYRHVVYSLNRVNGLGGLASLPFGEDKIAVAYGALPKGIFWEKRLMEVARWIRQDMKSKGIKPDLVEAHKFTIEGVIGLDIAREFHVPLVCDIQGGTDVRVLRMKKSLRPVYREIAKTAVAVLPFAPWMIGSFKQLVELDEAKCHTLPVVPPLDTTIPAPYVGQNKLVTVFHLDGWERKNFIGMAQAIKKNSAKRPDIILDVYGRGSPQTLMQMDRLLDKMNVRKHVRLMGAIEGGHLQACLQNYAALILPSKTETYGLVYAESLFSGVPVMFNASQAISGYFDVSDIGYGCDPNNVDDIAKGIEHLLVHEKTLKEKISMMQAAGAFEKLRKGNILSLYASVLDKVLSGA